MAQAWLSIIQRLCTVHGRGTEKNRKKKKKTEREREKKGGGGGGGGGGGDGKNKTDLPVCRISRQPFPVSRSVPPGLESIT